MNLLYFSIDDDSPTSGLSKKIKSQASALGTSTDGLWLLMASRKSGIKLYRFEKETSKLVLIDHEPGEIRRSVFLRYEYYAKNVASAFKNICEKESINAVYCRRIPMMPCLIKMLRTGKQKYQFTLGYEIPTFPYLQEYNKLKHCHILVSEFLFSRSLYSLVDHFFIITDSKNREKIRFRKWSRITNGVDVEKLPIRAIPPFDGKELHVLALANVAFWHGLDRLIEGIDGSEKNRRAILHIVGEGPDIPRLRRKVESRHLTDQVIFHGSLHGRDLDEMFDKCHIAAGSLGGHRKGFSETSELKIREYCGRGMPFFLSLVDKDFPSDYPYFLKIPSDESPVSMKTVFNFAKEVLSDRTHPQKMRHFAKKNLDWKIKMRPIIEYFEHAVKKR